jgi:hypothetical protein
MFVLPNLPGTRIIIDTKKGIEWTIRCKMKEKIEKQRIIAYSKKGFQLVLDGNTWQ